MFKREKAGLATSILFVRKSKALSTIWADSSYILLPKSVTWLHIAAICCCCSVAKSCLTLCDSRDCNIPGSSVLHYPQSLLKFMSIESLMLSNHLILCYPPSPSAFSHSQHQGLFQRVSSLHQVDKVLELQHQSFQWIFRVDFLEYWLVWSPYSASNSRVFQHHSLKTSVLQCSVFFMVQLSHLYMTTGKSIIWL